MTSANCANPKCSAELPVVPPGGTRTPCPKCGGTSVKFSVAESFSASVSVRTSVKLTPTGQERDWRQRWDQICRDLNRIEAPRQTAAVGGPEIQTARQELLSFYIQAYHLKD